MIFTFYAQTLRTHLVEIFIIMYISTRVFFLANKYIA